MSMGGDFKVHFSERPESLKEVLKQTMISQEVIFRKQVNELHRLYTTQKSLMKDIGWGEFNQYTLGKASPQSIFVPFANQIRCDLLAMGKTYTPVVNSEFLHEGRITSSKFQLRPLDLQLRTGNCNDYIDVDLSKKSNMWDTEEKFVEIKHHFLRDSVCYPKEVKLSLSIGGTSGTKINVNRFWNDKVICSQDIIDSEESTETTSNEDLKSVSTDLDELTERAKGVKLFNSCKATQLDLNKVVLDESYFHSVDSLGANPSLGRLSGGLDGIFGKVHGSSCSFRNSLVEPSSNNTSGDISANIITFGEAIGSKFCNIDLESMSGPPLDVSDGPFNDGRNFELSQQTPSEDELVGSSNSEMQHSCSEQKKGEEPVELDSVVQKAALSLLSISFEEISTSKQDCIMKSGSNQIENEGVKKPQYSSSVDSYESLVLKLKESSVEDDCVSSKPFKLDEMDKRECGIKLRRGRRLKDFQKDILPSLSSLSRQEIWEDIKIMEGVIRSREYKKLRANAASAENWFTPVRSRRSRLNYVGRKCYS